MLRPSLMATHPRTPSLAKGSLDRLSPGIGTQIV